MPRLKDVAQYVRSKAAGPFWVTIDVFCNDAESFARIRNAPGLNKVAVAGLYGVEEESVKVFEVTSLNVLKISFPRREPQGSLHDADSHAGQYFVPLLNAEVA